MNMLPSDEATRLSLIERYLKLTNEVMPDLAKSGNANWPVTEDHCFQRIVLDNVCEGVWYDKLKQPAYQHLGIPQAKRAVELCEQIILGSANIHQLNAKSLAWRKKQLSFTF